MKTAMRPVFVVLLVLAASLTLGICHTMKQSSANARKTLTAEDFRDHMKLLADAWNQGNARAAADLFAEGALYSSPPNSTIHDGREELFEWFGGSLGRPKPMQMVWHHLVFEEKQQIGAGEYTFTYEMRTHGMVLIRFHDGKIANWREYEIQSPLDWDVLVGRNNF